MVLLAGSLAFSALRNDEPGCGYYSELRPTLSSCYSETELMTTQFNEEIDPVELAKCLVEKDVKVYGSYYCGYCLKQKKEFLQGWEVIKENYIECSKRYGNPQICIDAGVKAVPSWDFNNGKELDSGFKSLQELKELSGC